MRMFSLEIIGSFGYLFLVGVVIVVSDVTEVILRSESSTTSWSYWLKGLCVGLFCMLLIIRNSQNFHYLLNLL